jgi:hypothetical protein
MMRGETYEGTACEFGHTTRYRRGGGCRACMIALSNQPHVVAARNAGRRERYRTPEGRRDRKERNLSQNYGLTIEDVEQMRVAQGFCCAICEGEDWEVGGLVVDHDHKTGMVRALLCNSCNRGLGAFRDQPGRMENAARYIRKHRI